MKKILALASVLLLAASLSYAQGTPSATGTANLTVNVGAEAAITVGSTSAFSSTGIFGNFLTTTPLTYFVRTKTAGTITVQITTDFSTGGVGGGPSVANPPVTSDALFYNCTPGSPATGTATGCTTNTVASTTTGTAVVTFGANVTTPITGTSASVAWDLPNDPAYLQGKYTAVATFTISAS
jgi:hypothetical protein